MPRTRQSASAHCKPAQPAGTAAGLKPRLVRRRRRQRRGVAAMKTTAGMPVCRTTLSKPLPARPGLFRWTRLSWFGAGLVALALALASPA